MSRMAHRAAAGFTLLEVLLAFVVFAISFAVVLQILSGSMRNTVRAREYTESALIAQSVMDQVGLDIPLEEGTRANGDSGDYRWTVDVALFAGNETSARAVELSDETGITLLEVFLDVSWGEGDRERHSEFSTVRAVLADHQLARSQ